jgi:hypothetical protein
MHLSANAIGRLLKGMETNDAYVLTYFYDEVLSHYLWHGGVIGLSALLIWRQWKNPLADEQSVLWPESLAGLIYGFTYFTIVTEGGTALLGVPYAGLVTLFSLGWGWKRMRQQPILTFFFVSAVAATILFACGAIRWGGLPQFSEVGIIE